MINSLKHFFRLLLSQKYKRVCLELYKKQEVERILEEPAIEDRYKFTNLEFMGYDLKVPDTPSFIWQIREIFEGEIYKFVSKNNKPIIYDCGANIGISCLYFKYLFPNSIIKAFEPDERIFQILKYNILNNKIKGVELLNKAVWVKNELLNFYSEGSDSGNILYKQDNSIDTKVDAVRLKEIIENENYIDLLKIDIEGAEVCVLEDCENSLDSIENIFIEYHSFANKVQDLHKVLSILTKNGFRYCFDNVTMRSTPFINKYEGRPMDLQLNIYAYRNFKSYGDIQCQKKC